MPSSTSARRRLRLACATAIALAVMGAGAGVTAYASDPVGGILSNGVRTVQSAAQQVVSGQIAQAPQAATSGVKVGAFGPPSSGVVGPSVALFNRETYQYRSNWPLAQEADRYQFIVLAGNDYWVIPALRAINPNLKFLLYQAIMFTNSQDYPSMQTVTGCTAYSSDIANHPSWFLRDQNDHVVRAPHNTADYAMDVGNPTYQQACAANAVAQAKRYGFDGIFFDVVEGRLQYTLRPGISVPEYPTRSSWENAMNSALAAVAPVVQAHGLLAFGNVGDASSQAVWREWVSHLDGVEEESWTNGGQGLAAQAPYWREKLSEATWAAASGKYEIVHAASRSQIANTYGLASMLLAASGRASYSTSNTNYAAQQQWFPEYATAEALGAPGGSYRILANGVYERAFARGIVLDNPTLRPVRPFRLGGDTYSGSGLRDVRAVQMPATSGLILLKSGR